MKQSESIGKISPALLAAQKKLPNVQKNAENPYFSSKYSDLTAVIEAIKGPLNEEDIAVVQLPTSRDDRDDMVGLTTRLLHSSGEWIEDTIFVKMKDTSPQAVGTMISYLRRYCLKATVGLADADDDAEAAQKAFREEQPRTGDAPKERGQMKVCPECGSQSVIKGKAEYGGGWLCWAKKGGCGAKFDDDDQRITGDANGAAQRVDPTVEPHRKAVLDHLLALFEAGRFDKETAGAVKTQANKAAIVPDARAAIAELKNILAGLPKVPDVDPDIDVAAEKGFKKQIGDKLDKLSGKTEEAQGEIF